MIIFDWSETYHDMKMTKFCWFYFCFCALMLGARETGQGDCSITRIVEWVNVTDQRNELDNKEFNSWNTAC